MSNKYACPNCFSSDVTNNPNVRINRNTGLTQEEADSDMWFCKSCWRKGHRSGLLDLSIVRERQEEEVKNALPAYNQKGMTYRQLAWKLPKRSSGGIFYSPRDVRNTLARLERKDPLLFWEVDDTRGFYRRKFYRYGPPS